VASHTERRKPRSAPVRRILATAFACLAAACLVLLPDGRPAYAEPTVAEIEKQIEEAWSKLEPVIEEHNATRIKLEQNRAKAAELAAKIEPLALQIDLAMAHVSDIAVEAYKSGPQSALNALLTSGSPTTLADQMSMLEELARIRKAEISTVIDLKVEYERQKAPHDFLVAQLTKTEAELAAKAKEIQAEFDRLQKLRQSVYEQTVGKTSLRPAPCPVTYPGGRAATAVKYACEQIGKSYVWGAAGPNSFDCSGLTMAAWAKAGVSLPHNAAAQRRSMPYIKRADLRPGDLVFYYSDLHHVGMYVGKYNGVDWIVHASQPGVPIKMQRMDASPIHSYGRPG